MTAMKDAVTEAVETMKAAERVIDGLMAVNARLRRENFAMLEALAQLVCPACEHELQRHADKYGCEIERGDAWVTGNQASAPTVLMAQGPCGCNVDDLKDDYPDFVRALEAFRLAKGVAL